MAKFTLSAFTVIFDNKGRVLLSHRRDLDIWNLPGGGLENGELPTEAVIRETLEETGLKIKIKKLIGVYGKPNKEEFSFVFLGEVIGGKLKKSKEADEHRFFKITKIPKNTVPKHLARVQDAARNNKKTVFYRQHHISTRKLLKKLKKEK